MVCDHCANNEAVIHFTQIVDNQMNTFHLCEECATEKGLDPGSEGAGPVLGDILAKLQPGSPTSPRTEACSFCGLTAEDFKKTGRLGCPHCYVVMESHLRRLLRRLHGGTQHVGKVYLPPDPTEAQRLERLNGLRRKLDHAVASEDFERAASIRDQIRDLETA